MSEDGCNGNGKDYCPSYRNRHPISGEKPTMLYKENNSIDKDRLLSFLEEECLL